eukprot:s1194_g4.t1
MWAFGWWIFLDFGCTKCESNAQTMCEALVTALLPFGWRNVPNQPAASCSTKSTTRTWEPLTKTCPVSGHQVTK